MNKAYMEKSFNEKYETIKHAIRTMQFKPAADFIFYELLENPSTTAEERSKLIKQLFKLIARDGRFAEDGIEICKLILADDNLSEQLKLTYESQLVSLLTASNTEETAYEAIFIIKNKLNDESLDENSLQVFTNQLKTLLYKNKTSPKTKLMFNDSRHNKALDFIKLISDDSNTSHEKFVKLYSKYYKDYNIADSVKLAIVKIINDTWPMTDPVIWKDNSINPSDIFTGKSAEVKRTEEINEQIKLKNYNLAADLLFSKPQTSLSKKEKIVRTGQLIEVIIMGGRYIEKGIDICRTDLADKNIDSLNRTVRTSQLIRLLGKKGGNESLKEAAAIAREFLSDENLDFKSRMIMNDNLIETLKRGDDEDKKEAILIAYKDLSDYELDAPTKNRRISKMLNIMMSMDEDTRLEARSIAEKYKDDDTLPDLTKNYINKVLLYVPAPPSAAPVKSIKDNKTKITLNDFAQPDTQSDIVFSLYKQLEEGYLIDAELKELIETTSDYRAQALALYKKSKQVPLKNSDISPELKELLPSSLIAILKMGNNMQAQVRKRGEFADFLKRTTNLHAIENLMF